MSCKLSSCRYSKESFGITISCAPRLNQTHKSPKKRKVVSSLGLEKYHGLLLFAALKPALLLGDINPKVSIDMRRAMGKSHSNAVYGRGEKT